MFLNNESASTKKTSDLGYHEKSYEVSYPKDSLEPSDTKNNWEERLYKIMTKV